jgi:hypothetical protein
MDYTEADLDYIHISDAIRDVNTPELGMELLFLIKRFENAYPNYYKTTYLRMKFLDKIDHLERLDTVYI